MKRTSLALLACFAVVALVSLSAKSKDAGAGVDKSHLQKIWDGWSTLNPDNVAQFYAKGPHTFFDIAPLKYATWDEYQAGVRNVLADYNSAKCTVNDDADLHPAGNYVWGSSTVNCAMTHKNGKTDNNVFRWTFVLEKQGGKWLTVHEHVSLPAA